MAHYLDPKNDLVFKFIFGEHQNLCMSLLNNMLPLEKDQQIVEIEYNSGELVPEIEALRNSIVDVRCTDNFGRQFLVEMQMYWTESFKSRVLFNASKAYVKQLNKAADFKLLKPVYALSFVNDIFDNTTDEYYHNYKIVNINDTEKQIKGLEFVFIELPKFKPQNIAEKKLHELWLRFLTEIKTSTQEIPAEFFESSEISEAVQYTEVGAYTKEQLDTYDDLLVGIVTARSAMTDFFQAGEKKGIEIGEKKGIEIGKKRGREEGEKKGIEIGEKKGREEGEKKKETEIVLTLANNGFPPEQIAAFTNISVESVKNILEQK